MSKREAGHYWVLWWANEAHHIEPAHWTGDHWELIGDDRPHYDDALAFIGDRLTPPALDIAKLRPQGEG